MSFIAKRLVSFIVALLAISAIIFCALRILPGDLAEIMAGVDSPPERVARLKEEMGLNAPLVEQYRSWMLSLVQGDFGKSLLTGHSVTDQVFVRAQITFPLIALGLFVALLLGVPLGLAAVLAKNPRIRGLLHFCSIAGGAVPALWAGLILVQLFGRGTGVIGILPSQGFPLEGWQDPLDAFLSLLLPALTTGVIVGATLMRHTRSAVSDFVDSGYIEMAMASGMTRVQAVLKVGLRLALPQLVSVIGLTFAAMTTGVMVAENLFALPGIGGGLVADIGNRDLIAVQGELLMLSAFFLGIGLLVDTVHRLLDPRLGRVDAKIKGGVL